jgi:hypothetical protein
MRLIMGYSINFLKKISVYFNEGYFEACPGGTMTGFNEGIDTRVMMKFKRRGYF